MDYNVIYQDSLRALREHLQKLSKEGVATRTRMFLNKGRGMLWGGVLLLGSCGACWCLNHMLSPKTEFGTVLIWVWGVCLLPLLWTSTWGMVRLRMESARDKEEMAQALLVALGKNPDLAVFFKPYLLLSEQGRIRQDYSQRQRSLVACLSQCQNANFDNIPNNQEKVKELVFGATQHQRSNIWHM